MPDLVAGVVPQVKRYVDLYRQAKTIRSPNEQDWRRVAELGLPRHFGGWVTTEVGGMGFGEGASRTARAAQFDSTLSRSIPKFGAVCERLLTPNSQIYHSLRPSDPALLKSRAVREYYEAYNDLLFSLRYHPRARFTATQGETYQSVGAYGNACKMITWRGAGIQGSSMRRGRYSGRGGMLYRNIKFRNMYWFEDHEEQVNMWFRRIDWTARQAVEALKDRCPKKVKEVADKSTAADMNRTFEFFQLVMPNGEFVEHSMDYRRFPYLSVYVFVDEPEIVADPSGYHCCPFITPRAFTEGGSPYGYGYAQQVLSSVGTLNAQKKTMLKVGQKKADPPLLARDDGILNGTVDVTPSAVNYGGIDSQGRKMIAALDVGDLQVAEKLIEMQQADVEDAFFVTLFKQMQERPQMTATEVMQMAADTAAQLSPTMGRFQAEDLGPTIEREIDLCEQNGIAPEKPAEILDNPEYDVVYTSPLAKAARSESSAGFFRLVEAAGNYAKMTNDTRPLKRLNFNRALPEIAEQQNVPARWISTDEEVAADLQQEKQGQMVQQATDALPGVASLARTASTSGGKPAGV